MSIQTKCIICSASFPIKPCHNGIIVCCSKACNLLRKSQIAKERQLKDSRFAPPKVGTKKAKKISGKPVAIVARTIKGKGVSFMENKMEWHYLPMSEDQYKKAVYESGAENA